MTAGGVSIGRQKLRQQQVLNSSPLEMQFAGGGTVPSRAAAAAGQSGLMALYDSLFGMMDLQAAQVLVTRNDFTGAALDAAWWIGLCRCLTPGLCSSSFGLQE